MRLVRKSHRVATELWGVDLCCVVTRVETCAHSAAIDTHKRALISKDLAQVMRSVTSNIILQPSLSLIHSI